MQAMMEATHLHACGFYCWHVQNLSYCFWIWGQSKLCFCLAVMPSGGGADDWQQVLNPWGTSVCHFSCHYSETKDRIWDPESSAMTPGSFILQNNIIWVSIKHLAIWWNTGKRQPWFSKDLQSNIDNVISRSGFAEGGQSPSLLERAFQTQRFQGTHDWAQPHVCDAPVDLVHPLGSLSDSAPFPPMSSWPSLLLLYHAPHTGTWGCRMWRPLWHSVTLLAVWPNRSLHLLPKVPTPECPQWWPPH